MRRSEYQATVYLTSVERTCFEQYARQFLLDAAGLLALLFGRELRVARLRELIPEDHAPDDARRSKVTAHVDGAAHAALTALAQAHGKGLSQIGAVLVRAELRDRWLEQAYSTRFESQSVE
ncbi:hypothetical protein [Sphingopyxis sp.]|uniref:hypothetical protein n=1 Tax=Sphingopyxis sp. TaxID=1908224 RepID=UPI002D7A31F3|nr:hypothetical protein [Sphingopyxis sp.]HET6523188.1 hypothetical protein [Sphingopyxis sp.]